MPKFKIHHITRYVYQHDVRDSANQVILYPVQDEWQDVLKHTITISSNPVIDVFTDYYGNKVGHFTQREPHNTLTIQSDLTVETRNRPLPNDEMFASQQWDDLVKLTVQVPYIDFLRQEYFAARKELKDLVSVLRRPEDTPYKAALHFCDYVYNNFKYHPGVTSIETTVDEIWSMRSGVCQDFAHILLEMLRSVHIPARYVSGYICPNHNGMRGEGATHAWVEAWLPSYGWLGLDPTNNCVANDTHVRLAVGRSFGDCSPVKGVYKGSADHDLEVAVSVAYEDGSVTSLPDPEPPVPKPVSAFAKNSYMRHVELMQQQQQQQQQ
ncbi:MAG: transglutaminase family protein [Mucilaginibacter polytrichastri]|nr:transglutaminase family protein [Mucilaginibacter polytrichastri]